MGFLSCPIKILPLLFLWVTSLQKYAEILIHEFFSFSSKFCIFCSSGPLFCKNMCRSKRNNKFSFIFRDKFAFLLPMGNIFWDIEGHALRFMSFLVLVLQRFAFFLPTGYFFRKIREDTKGFMSFLAFSKKVCIFLLCRAPFKNNMCRYINIQEFSFIFVQNLLFCLLRYFYWK